MGKCEASLNKLMTETEFNFDVRVRLEFVIERLSLAQTIFPCFLFTKTKIKFAREMPEIEKRLKEIERE